MFQASLCAALLLALTGCAASAASPPVASAWPYGASSPAAQRGHDFAVRRCSGCHTVGLDDGGAADGPPFRRLAHRYNALSLSMRFREISAHGFDRMPPISFSQSEADDLVAYIETLDHP